MRSTILAAIFSLFFSVSATFAEENEKDSATDLVRFAQLASESLGRSLERLSRPQADLDCRKPETFESHMLAAFTRNDFRACQRLQTRCETENPSLFENAPLSALWAGDCARANNDRKRSKAFYKLARSEKHADRSDFLFIVLHSAWDLWDYPGQETDDLFQKNFWTLEQRKGLLALFRRDSETMGQIELFVEKEIQNEKLDHLYRAELLHFMILVHMERYEYRRALNFVRDHLDLCRSSLSPYWIASVLYVSLFSVDDVPLEAVRNFYRAMVPYASTRAWLPTEHNSYTYTELYEDVCRDRLLSPDGLAVLLKLADSWLASTVTPEEALAGLEALEVAFPQRSDILTLRGSILIGLDDLDGAEKAFWQAHEACVFYNKAHTGLKYLATKRNQLSSAKSVQELLNAKELREWDESLLRVQIEGYSNLGSMDKLLLKKKLFFWKPYLDQLHRNNSVIYILTPDRLVSQVPGLSHMRDMRVSSRRLSDDIGGIKGGGVAVVSSEAVIGWQKSGNTVVHELAHGFQSLLGRNIACVLQMYQQAKERQRFVDNYSARANTEYFAVGVEKYTMEPMRLKEIDPDLFAFIASIERSQGDIGKIQCPFPLTYN